MFRPKKMRKVRLIVLKSKVEYFIKDLHEAGLVDIRKSSYEGLEEGRPLPVFDQVSTELLRMRTALAIMEPYAGKGEGELVEDAMGIAKRYDAPERIRKMNQEANLASEKLKSLDAEAVLAEKLSRFKGVDFSHLSTRSVGFKAGELPSSKIPKLQEALGKIGSATFVSESGSNLALVLFGIKDQQAVETLLSESGFNELQVPQSMTVPAEALKRIDSERASAKGSLKSLKDEMAGISAKEIKKVRSLLRSLEVEAERAEIASRFPSSKSMCVIEGWMLEESRLEFDKIAQRYGASMSVEDVQFDHHEMPPTVLNNPKYASPLEFITNSYSLPNYFEIDPTMAYLVMLPIIYGMIVGDVVYGLMSMVIAYWLMKKYEKSYIMYNVSKIWLYSAVPTVLFGFFYDEFAGMSHFKIAQFIQGWTGITLLSAPLWTGFHRLEGVLALIALSALIGVLHLALGFTIGAINEWNHDRKHAMAKIAWIGVELGVVLALLPFMPMLMPEMGHIDQSLAPAGLIVLVISVICLAITEGVIGIIELPGLIGNILSYSRIAAIGIVGVVIAELLNDFMIPSSDKGLVLALALAPIFILFHVLNCFMAMFEAIIQGGRLNIVEFRSKFMHGGGDVFIPFALYSKKL